MCLRKRRGAERSRRREPHEQIGAASSRGRKIRYPSSNREPVLRLAEREPSRVARERRRARGSLALAVTVDGEGAVTKVELGPGYPASARTCVEARVKSVRFPKEPNAGIGYYRYPINEQPEADGGDPD